MPLPSKRPVLRVVAALLGIGLGVFGADLTGISDGIDNRLIGLRFQAAERAPTGDVVLVDIDAKSLAEVGVWPWPRSLHGDLVSAASRMGAARIAFDVDFSASSSQAEHAAFAEALAASRAETFLATFVQQDPADTGALVAALPSESLLQHSWPAAVNVPVDGDGAVRRFPFSIEAGDETIASMPVILADRAPSHGLFGIDFSIRAKALPRVSYTDIINNRVSPAKLSGKTIIVGATALELRDLFAVPAQGIVSGSTIIAMATETLLQGRELAFKDPPPLFLFGAGVVALLAFRLIPSWRVVLVLAGVAAAVESAALYLQMHGNTALQTGSLQVLLAGFVLWALAREFDLRRLLLWAARTETGNAEHILERVVDDGFDGVIIIDDQDRVARINQLGLDLLQREGAGRLEDLPAEITKDVRTARRSFAEGGVLERKARQLEHFSGDHDRRIIEFTVAPFWLKKLSSADQARDVTFVCLTLRDVTERQIAQEQMRFMALHDGLTGIYNRRALEQRLDEILASSSRQDHAALISFDLDRFKVVNDALGHPMGDKVLGEVAKRATAVFGEDAIVARVGGDEFTALLTGDAAAEAQHSAEALVAAVSKPFLIHGHRILVGASVGVVQWIGTENAARSALRQADVALYRAKHSGAQIVFFEPSMEADRLTRLALERDLESAFEENQFELVYQPQVSLATGDFVGAEALLRWRHPVKGLISPAAFISVAEEMGLIHRLGSWVLAKACCDAARWPVPIKVAVNVSSLQFETGDLIAAVQEALRVSNLPATRLELEITESAFVQESERLKGIFDQLLALEVSFSLDDFGTGYSSLGYLHRFPISKIKIDRSFVVGMPHDGHSLAILRSIEALAEGLGIRTIAEGIETREQAEALRVMGCDYGQGYLYAKPLTDNELRHLIQPHQRVTALAS